MSQFLVEVRPQRTSDQIAADRKAGTAFFARYDTENPHTRSSWNRDLDSLLRFYSYEWNLVCCVLEATEWMRTHPHDTRTDRITARIVRAVRELAEEIPARDDSQLQAYVHVSTIKLMHPPRVVPIPVADRLAARSEATRFWALCANPTPPGFAAEWRPRPFRSSSGCWCTPCMVPCRTAPPDTPGPLG